MDSNLRLTNWKRKQGCKCQYKHIVDWCGCSPNVFKPDDWPRLLNTELKPYYFARKFEPVISQEMINKLENWVSKDSAEESASFHKYWQNEFHHLDRILPKDGKLSLFTSLSNIAIQRILNSCTSNSHYFVPNNKSWSPLYKSYIKQANLYLAKDVFKGLLISFETHISNDSDTLTTIEAYFGPTKHLIINHPDDFNPRLLNLKVTS